MSQTIKNIGLIFAIIAACLPVRASSESNDCETFGSSTTKHTSDTLKVKVNFRFDDALVLQDFKDNNIGFAHLESFMKEKNNIDSVAIIGFSSPEGWSGYNYGLAKRRAEAMRNYMYWKYPSTRSIPISLNIDQDMVSSLKRYIDLDNNVPRRNKVLEVLSDESRSTDTRVANLKLIAGNSYNYIKRNIFPQMRMSVSYFVYYKTPSVEPQVDTSISNDSVSKIDAKQEIIKEDTIIADTISNIFTPVTDTINTPIEYVYKPLFSLKTNLLFDAASLLNLELELPIGKRWSVAGEWIFPWWLWEDKQHCLQVLSGNIEGKYWFGNRGLMSNGKERPVMTGWYAGLYAGGGYYDLEWDKVGYQGEFFIAAGISAGFAHTINKSGSLRMEYSVGIGYMQTNYRKYDAEQDANGKWHLYLNSKGKYTWVGPTRVRVSFVWMINSKKKGGSVR